MNWRTVGRMSDWNPALKLRCCLLNLRRGFGFWYKGGVMHMRQTGQCALLILVLAALFSGGCKKEEGGGPAAQAPRSTGAETPVVARVHWLGKKRIAAETNSAYFMTLWNLPETAELEAQTLDKLATAPWRLLLHQAGGTNIA